MQQASDEFSCHPPIQQVNFDSTGALCGTKPTLPAPNDAGRMTFELMSCLEVHRSEDSTSACVQSSHHDCVYIYIYVYICRRRLSQHTTAETSKSTCIHPRNISSHCLYRQSTRRVMSKSSIPIYLRSYEVIRMPPTRPVLKQDAHAARCRRRNFDSEMVSHVYLNAHKPCL